MTVNGLLSNLQYRGEAVGLRQTYHVFEGSHHFFVLSFSRTKSDSGNFNIVEAEALNYVRAKFAGEMGLTAKELHNRCRRPQYVKTPLEALNILYILVALDQAQLDHRFEARELHFNIKP